MKEFILKALVVFVMLYILIPMAVPQYQAIECGEGKYRSVAYRFNRVKGDVEHKGTYGWTGGSKGWL